MYNTKEEIIKRLHEIDVEINSQTVIKTTRIYNSWLERYTGSIKKKFYKDRYRVFALKAERDSYLVKLKEMSSQALIDGNSQNDQGKDERELKAIQNGARIYIEEKKPKRLSNISKSRTIACKVVKDYYPELSGKPREQKIDSLRAKIQLEVKKQMKIK